MVPWCHVAMGPWGRGAVGREYVSIEGGAMILVIW